MHVAFVTLALALSASARPMKLGRRAEFDLKNGQDAIALNQKFAGLQDGAACQAGENACIGDKFAQCVGGKFVSQPCAPGTICAALPLVNSPGTSITCTTAADRDARIAATGAQAGGAAPPAAPPANPPPADQGNNNQNNGNNGQGAGNQNNAGNGGAAGGADPNLTLDPAVIATGFAQDGQSDPNAGPGQVPSLTSTNNFINFCKDKGTITNGKQVKEGSCNPAPMGQIPAIQNMPSSKFQFPTNFQQINEGQSFTIKMAIKNLETGNFVNAQANYYSAPQQLNAQGIIRGHSHVVVEKIDSFQDTTPKDPNVFAFFLGLNGAAQGGVLTADVTKGLPAGVYKLSSINAAANHQPVLAPIAQHGSLDDAVYFEVVTGGAANNGNAGAAAGGAAPAAAPALQANSSTSSKGGKGGKSSSSTSKKN